MQNVATRGRGRGEFTNPQGVAVTKEGDILVADSNTQCVQVTDDVYPTSIYTIQISIHI